MKKFAIVIFALLAALSCQSQSSFKSLNVRDFSEKISSKAVQVVDVRTPEEYATGFIPNATNLDVKNEAAFAAGMLKYDKSAPVALYCRSGKRSKVAAERFAKAGFTTVYELSDGILGWQKAGKTVVQK